MIGFKLQPLNDYREILRTLREDFLREGTSKRALARKLGFGSASYLDMVIIGHRNLSSRAAWRIVRALGMDSAEAEGFVRLVVSQNAKLETERSGKLEDFVLNEVQLESLREYLKKLQDSQKRGTLKFNQKPHRYRVRLDICEDLNDES